MPAEAATPSSLGALAVLVDSVLLLAPKAPWPPALQARVQGWAPALGAEPQAWLQALQGLQPELLARAHRGSG
jgi:hypothetical protein